MYYFIILIIIILESQLNVHGWLAIIGLIIIILIDIRQKIRVIKWVDAGYSINIPYTSSPLDKIVARLKKERNRSRKRKAQLQQFLSAYREIVVALPEAAFIVDKRGLLLNMNKQAKIMLNLNKHLDIGVSIDYLLRGENITHFSKAIENTSRLQVRLINSDANNWFEFSKFPLTNDNTLFIARDISQEMELDLKRKVFIDNASHELKTPISIIKDYIEILDNDDLPESSRQSVRGIKKQTKQLQLLTQDMFHLFKLEQANICLNEEKIAMHEFIQDSVTSILKTYPNQAEIQVQPFPELRILGDRKILQSAIKHLLENAILYANNHPISIQITRIHSSLHIAITDQGIGIAASQIKRITQRFYRVDDTRQTAPGSGLGLSIVKHAIEAHDGNLQIQSQLGKGSTFTLVLPKSRIIEQ